MKSEFTKNFERAINENNKLIKESQRQAKTNDKPTTKGRACTN